MHIRTYVKRTIIQCKIKRFNAYACDMRVYR